MREENGSGVGRPTPPTALQCQRCESTEQVERHHWAPRQFFADADKWGTAPLCRKCHREWHKVMTSPPERAPLQLGEATNRSVRCPKCDHILFTDKAYAEMGWGYCNWCDAVVEIELSAGRCGDGFTLQMTTAIEAVA